MVTIVSDMITAGNTTTAPVGGGMICRYSKVTLPATLAVNDIVQLLQLEDGDVVHDLKVKLTDIDTNGTPTVVLDFGDGTDEGRFINGSTVGQAGGTDVLDAGVMPFQYTAKDTLDMKVVTGAATAAAGTVEAWAYVTGKY